MRLTHIQCYNEKVEVLASLGPQLKTSLTTPTAGIPIRFFEGTNLIPFVLDYIEPVESEFGVYKIISARIRGPWGQQRTHGGYLFF